MGVRVGFVSLGCPKNQVDCEHLIYNLRETGFEIVADAALSDVVVINTCGFIESAKQEAIDTILEFCTLKNEGRIKAVIVTGCLAERYFDDIRTDIPEVDAVVGLGANEMLGEIINKVSDGVQADLKGDKYAMLQDVRRVVSTETFAYLKIAEGCSNCCTYCAIPSIRGKLRSRRIESIVDEAKWLAKVGFKEIILVAQDTTVYGEDIYGEPKICELLRQLCKIDGIKWLRTLYCYPERITDEFIDLLASEDKLVKYLDIPIQHSVDRVLKRMNRKSTHDEIVSLIKKLRERVPGIILRTTLIAGFPGETDDEFTQLCEFVKEAEFDRLGCFAYSQEEGTAAARLPDQIDEAEKQRRADIVMETQMIISDRKNQARIGSDLEVVCEGWDRYAECFYGRSYAEAPEIDGKIFFTSKKPCAVGQFLTVHISEAMDYDLLGEVK